jgi:hypothetical protein
MTYDDDYKLTYNKVTDAIDSAGKFGISGFLVEWFLSELEDGILKTNSGEDWFVLAIARIRDILNEDAGLLEITGETCLVCRKQVPPEAENIIVRRQSIHGACADRIDGLLTDDLDGGGPFTCSVCDKPITPEDANVLVGKQLLHEACSAEETAS